MKRSAIALLALLATATGLEAQSNDAMIQRALAPLSGRAAEGAAVVRWNADGSYTTIREGSNAYVCYDRSGEGSRPAFAVQCTNVGNLERLAQNRRFESEAMGDRDVLNRLVSTAESNGSRVPAVFGSVWISMNGADQASAGRHMTVAVPGATAESLGFPDNGRAGGLWIMAGGTSEAHLMVP